MMAVAPRDLASLGRGVVTPRLAPFLEEATAECADVLEALGGAGNVSAPRRVIVEDLARVGVVLRGTLAAYLRSEDPELASKVGALATARRSLLVSLGLDRVSKELDLHEYLAARENAENASDGPNADEPDKLRGCEWERVSRRRGRRVGASTPCLGFGSRPHVNH